MDLGSRIREIRLQKDLTQTALGELLGVQQSAIRKYEYNEVDIPKSKLEKLSEILGVSTDYLLGKTDWKTPEERDRQFDEWDAKNIHRVSQKKFLEIAENLKGARVAFYDGALDGLDEDDIEMLLEMAKHLRTKKENKDNKNE